MSNVTLTSHQLRARYLAFFVERGHVAIPSASLVPTNDPTVLFTTAGMHPLVPNLLGEPHPAGRRLVNVQRCVRTGDLELIGDATHLSSFEMLGNWSLGDYGRDEAIGWSFELLTDPRWLGLPIDGLGVTCFAGDDDVPRDVESARRWTALGIPPARIQWRGRDDNWWGPAGQTGPCGPDTEIFYWVDPSPAPDALDVDDPRWVEIWNNVFMSHRKTASGGFEPLGRINVDTGMGLERVLVALNGLGSVYEVDTVAPVLAALRALAPSGAEPALRVMTDHLRAAALVICDGVAPSNKDRGYVVRRLLRRCAMFARRLAMPSDWYRRGLVGVIAALGEAYPALGRDAAVIEQVIAAELDKFSRSLAHGLVALGKLAVLDGAAAFELFQTHGFPFELTVEIAEAMGVDVDRAGFVAQLEAHRAVSRTTVRGAFAGGLEDHTPEILRHHTLTHLLQAALRQVLGAHVVQRGSNLTRDRLRFDFAHDGKPSADELARVEAMVNGWLARPLAIERAVMATAEAHQLGALGAFGETYGATVSVYAVRDLDTGDVISREICGGPHVASGAALAGRLRIVREQAVSAGTRRIKAVFEDAAAGAQ